jgi:transketolase
MHDHPLQPLAHAIRLLAIDAIVRAQEGHQGVPLGMAEIATVLYTRHLKFDPADPTWFDRDRVVLSNGHGSMLLYALLHLTGYAAFPIEAIRSFRELGSPCAGHPERDVAAGIEVTTGPLGQGIANALGMAVAEERLAAMFGRDRIDHFTYAFVGDGCLQEGVGQEMIHVPRCWRAAPSLHVACPDCRASAVATALGSSMRTDASQRAAFERAMQGALQSGWRDVLHACKREAITAAPAASGISISAEIHERLNALLPERLIGCADLEAPPATSGVRPPSPPRTVREPMCTAVCASTSWAPWPTAWQRTAASSRWRSPIWVLPTISVRPCAWRP